MNILFLTPRLPYPPYRGDKLKIFNLIRQLSARHNITLLSFVSRREELEHVPALREYCDEVRTVYMPAWRSMLRCLPGFLGRLPLQVVYYRSAAMRRELASLLGSQTFDVLHVHLIRMAQYAADIRGQARVLDLTDAGSLYLDRFRRTAANPLVKLLVGAELGRLIPYEKIVASFDVALVCSPVDRTVLAGAAPTARLELLYNGIDLDQFTPDENRRPDPDRIIYTGNLSYFPNADGIRYFVAEILPLIRREVPSVKLQIVGKDPPARVRNLASESVKVTGFVPDIRAEYLASAVAIAPVRFGAGTLNKVLEPMALGVPVVSTPIGAEGLPFESGTHLMLAGSPEDFARGVVSLLKDPALRRKLSANGMEIVRSNYGWGAVAGTLEDVYSTLLHR